MMSEDRPTPAQDAPLILPPDAAAYARAAALLRAGGLVAFPTETVYGLGADATDDRAVARVFEAKGRPSFNPLIAHIPSVEAARALCDFDDAAERLAAAFWPGALTLVLPMRPNAGISKLVTAGGDRLAVRVPESDTARRLLEAVGRPVAAPSANPSGRRRPSMCSPVSTAGSTRCSTGDPALSAWNRRLSVSSGHRTSFARAAYPWTPSRSALAGPSHRPRPARRPARRDSSHRITRPAHPFVWTPSQPATARF